MLLNSYVFLLIFFPLTYALYWHLILPHARLFFLTLVSLIFAGAGNPTDILTLVLVIILTWGVGQALARRHNRFVLLLGIATVLIPLLLMKYTGFILANVGMLLQQPWQVSAFPLPIGLSFYTFQAVSYLVDLYQGKIAPGQKLLPVACYLAFFPHLIAGPILRYPSISASVQNLPERIDEEKRFEAVVYIILGLARKVLIADTLAVSVNRLLLAPESLEFWSAWAAMLGYSFQLYYDFSGYSMIAIGIAGMFGVPFPQNFNRPYTALNISDFWRRWHISLSQWLRDYLYIPLGGNRGGQLRMLLNLALTMVIGGIWHGAAWTFVFWGMYHGIILIAYHVTRPLKWIHVKPLSRVITFVSIVIGWVLFRSTSLEMAGTIYRAMFGLQGSAPFTIALDQIGLSFVGVIGIAALIEWGLPQDIEHRLQPRWIEAGVFVVLAVWALLSMGTTQQFLYFQF